MISKSVVAIWLTLFALSGMFRESGGCSAKRRRGNVVHDANFTDRTAMDIQWSVSNETIHSTEVTKFFTDDDNATNTMGSVWQVVDVVRKNTTTVQSFQFNGEMQNPASMASAANESQFPILMEDKEFVDKVLQSLQGLIPSTSLSYYRGVRYTLHTTRMQVSKIISFNREDTVERFVSEKVYFNCSFHISDMQMDAISSPLGRYKRTTSIIELKDVDGLVVISALDDIVRSERIHLHSAITDYEIAKIMPRIHKGLVLSISMLKRLFEHSLNSHEYKDLQHLQRTVYFEK